MKNYFLKALIISVLLGALLGIFLVLRNTWGWLEVRVMLTTLIVAGASLCGLASEQSRSPLSRNWMANSGLLLTTLGTLLLLTGTWAEIGSEAFWKSTAVICIFAVATVHVCLLSAARLPFRYRFTHWLAAQLVYGLGLLLAFMVISENFSSNIWRIVATLSILVAAISLVIPILHRLGRHEAASDAQGVTDELLPPSAQRDMRSIDREIEQLQARIEQLRLLRAKIGRDA